MSFDAAGMYVQALLHCAQLTFEKHAQGVHTAHGAQHTAHSIQHTAYSIQLYCHNTCVEHVSVTLFLTLVFHVLWGPTQGQHTGYNI